MLSKFPLRFLRGLLTCLTLLVVLWPVTLPAQTALDAAATEEAAEDAPQFAPELTDPLTDTETLELRVLPLTVDELPALADIWLGHAKEGTSEVTDLRIDIREAGDDPEVGDIRDALAVAMEHRGIAFSNLAVVVDNLESKGGDEAAIQTYRAYRNAVLAVEAQKTDWKTLADLGLKWALDRDGGIALAMKVGVVLGVLLVLLMVSKIVKGGAVRGLRRVPNISKLLVAFLSGVVYWLVIAVGLMIVLSALGVNITPLFALFGGAAFIVAFAMQDTLGNLAAGVMIIINRPFDEGDYVNVAGVGGTVQSVSIVSTTVTTPDNQLIVIPNSKVWGDVINNVTASTTRRVDLVFGIGYDDSIASAQAILERVVTDHPMVLSDPAPVIRVNELADSSVNFVCRPWVRTSDYWTVYWDLMRGVKEAFDAEGISIPFPQTDMHLHVSGPVPIGTEKPAEQSAVSTGRPQGAPDFAAGDAPTD